MTEHQLFGSSPSDDEEWLRATVEDLFAGSSLRGRLIVESVSLRDHYPDTVLDVRYRRASSSTPLRYEASVWRELYDVHAPGEQPRFDQIEILGGLLDIAFGS